MIRTANGARTRLERVPGRLGCGERVEKSPTGSRAEVLPTEDQCARAGRLLAPPFRDHGRHEVGDRCPAKVES